MAGLRLVAATCAIGIAASGAASGQAFPTHPIRIVASAAGGGSDFMTRLIAQGLSPALGQSVIIDNRGGGSIPGEIVSKAAPDGHTLLYYGSAFWLSPLMRDHVPYDVARDFAPISLIISAPSMLVAHPSLPVSSAKELIALAKAKPGALNYGSASAGASNHLAAELFKNMAGVDIVRVPHRGSGPAIISLLGNQVQILFGAIGGVAPHVKQGRLKALGITSAERTPQFPDLPTIASTGLPGYEFTSIWGLFAPAKTPRPVIDRLYREIAKVLNAPEVKEKATAAGDDIIASSPEQFAAAVKSDIVRLGKVIKDAHIREE